ncbi:5'-methylthioadenosine/S-adenosylhomocysteine nucleosidase family protein [Streptomyces sp. NPDC001635]
MASSVGGIGGGDRSHDGKPIGIVSALPAEQAAVLAKMVVERQANVHGFHFYVGTISGRPVVSVASGELDPTAQLATWLLNSTFHPRATLFSGTAGAQNASINLGDVVLSGYVVDKEAIHYRRDGRQTPYPAAEVHVTESVNIAGAVISRTDHHRVSHPTDPSWVHVQAFAASRELVRIGAETPALGSVSRAEATGSPTATGRVANKVVTGVIGQAPVWTESLEWIQVQNMLYQTDAEENEGTGFAFANAVSGVPWALIRGISDTPWYPHIYDGDLASKRAAQVCAHLVTHLPSEVDPAPVRLRDLSPVANARQAGYLIADEVSYQVGPVTELIFTGPQGRRTLTGRDLTALRRQYTAETALPSLDYVSDMRRGVRGSRPRA